MAVQTDSRSADQHHDALMQALGLAVQHTVNGPKALLDLSTFARLLCVSRKLQETLESAAVGCLIVDLTLSMNGSPARSCIEPELTVPISENQLSFKASAARAYPPAEAVWAVSTHPAETEVRSGLSAELPALEHLWKGMCPQHRACIQPGGSGSLASCGEHLTCVVYSFKWRSWLHMGPLAPCMACICWT